MLHLFLFQCDLSPFSFLSNLLSSPFVQTATKLYLVMDYCGGGELFFHLGKQGKFAEPLAKFYAAEIVLAIDYLHGQGRQEEEAMSGE